MIIYNIKNIKSLVVTPIRCMKYLTLIRKLHYSYHLTAFQCSQKKAAIVHKKKLGSPPNRSWQIRILHTLGFKVGLLFITIPIISMVLSVSLWQAFLLNIDIVIFYLIYIYFYNTHYDRYFPILIS